jgi:hypothetical protein
MTGMLLSFAPGTQTTAESPRYAHPMGLVQVFIGTVPFPPPDPKAPGSLPIPK